MIALITLAQRYEFACEIESLKLHSQVNKSSKLRSLLPFLDEQNILRGRLANTPIPYAQKYPIILPSKHPLMCLIILSEHYKHLHAGPQALLATIRTQFWPIHARGTVRDVLWRCIVWFRSKPPIIYQ